MKRPRQPGTTVDLGTPPAGRLPLRNANSFFVLALIVLGVGAIMNVLRLPDPEGDPFAGSADDGFQRMVWFFIYGMIIMSGVQRRIRLRRALSANPWVLLLVVQCLLSTIWSSTPGLTFRRSFAIALSTIVAFYISQMFHRYQLVELAYLAVAFSLLASLVVVVFIPGIGVYNDVLNGSTWRGVFLHKQPLGRAASLYFVFSGSANEIIKHRLPRFLLAALALLLILRSHSATATATWLIIVVLKLALPKLRRLRTTDRRIALIALSCTSLLLAGYTTGASSAVLRTLGRDSSITGRTQAWDAALPEVSRHLWLGWGVSNFWRGTAGPGSARVWAVVPWHPVHAHSGYLDVLLDVGAIGAILLLMGGARLMILSWKEYLRTGQNMSLAPILFVAFLLVQAFSESVLLRPNSAFWFLFSFFCFSATAHVRQGRGCQRLHDAPSSSGTLRLKPTGFDDCSGYWVTGSGAGVVWR